MEMISPSTKSIPPSTLTQALETAPNGRDMMLKVGGLSDIGDPITFFVPLEIDGKDAAERLANTGLTLRQEGDKVLVDDVAFDSAAQQAGFDWDQEILDVKMPVDGSLPKELLFIPAIATLVGIAWLQRRRRAHRIGHHPSAASA